MPDRLVHLHGVPVLNCSPDGQKLGGDREVVDLIGEALRWGAEVVLVPAERLPDEFFRLDTRLAGEVIQKFVNYRLRLAIVGDISRHLARSSALRDFVAETNRGRQVWFVSTAQELDTRLKPRATG